MGYAKIRNLYSDSTIIDVFSWVFVQEKIHGTSVYVGYIDGKLSFHSGGVQPHSSFVDLFNQEKLLKAFEELGHGPDVPIKIHGEAYGGKMQKMSHTYGPALKFVAFDVKIGDHWLGTDKADNVVRKLGLEFVHWVKGPEKGEDIFAFVDRWRDADSQQAIRNGMGSGKMREGIVIKAPVEVLLNNGERLMAKHKRSEFAEQKHPPKKVDPERQQRIDDAREVADEYVVDMRLEHVLDKLVAVLKDENSDEEFKLGMQHTPLVIKSMVEDIRAEEGGSIEWTQEVSKEIGKRAAILYKARVMQIKESV